MEFRSRVIKYGDNVDTDVIIPSKYLVHTDPKELAKYAMAGLDERFAERIKERSIVVAGRNFGCGSSREQAPVSLKYAGVKCVVAESFARIFYRNSVNVGLPVLECPKISSAVSDGDEVSVDMEKGVVTNVTRRAQLTAVPTPDFILEIMKEGLVEYVKARKK